MAQQGQPTQNVYGTILSLHNRMQGGLPWVATPALLKAFGISQGEVNPAADVLTARALLPSTGDLALVSGAYLAQSPNTPCPAGMCIQNPVIQEVSKLPAGTSVPNTVITEEAVKALHETVVPVGWLIQAPSALTPAQVNAARQAAVGLGTTIETKSGQLSLGEISNGATVGGLLLALGVLAMTVGLIRSETVGDLRTLTAAGAGARTRRALTGVTAGVIAFLGAALGVVGGCLAVFVWSHANLTTTFGNVPWSDIGLLVIGMPLVGGAAALAPWRPPAVRRLPPAPGVVNRPGTGTTPSFGMIKTISPNEGVASSAASARAWRAGPARGARFRHARKSRPSGGRDAIVSFRDGGAGVQRGGGCRDREGGDPGRRSDLAVVPRRDRAPRGRPCHPRPAAPGRRVGVRPRRGAVGHPRGGGSSPRAALSPAHGRLRLVTDAPLDDSGGTGPRRSPRPPSTRC